MQISFKQSNVTLHPINKKQICEFKGREIVSVEQVNGTMRASADDNTNEIIALISRTMYPETKFCQCEAE